MALPPPVPGLVIRYSYLWTHEAAAGREEGRKDRPCVIVLAVQPRDDGALFVTVAPVTHTPPVAANQAVEIPAETKLRLGLDSQPSWIVTTEVNSFTWPGPDLRPISWRRPDMFDYGVIPLALFRRVRAQLLGKTPLANVRR
jgi:mRNA-degrading endonuclease toxin of MazEF toxin-antitoxin module